MSSMSPRKRQKQMMIPEVVIMMDSRHSLSPRSPGKTRAARTAHFDRIQKRITEEDDKAFKGLSRLEQIKLRAKRKAQSDEKSAVAMEDFKASKGIGRRGLQEMKEEDDEEEDDDLPDLDVHTLQKGTLSSPLSSAPSTTRSGRVITSSMTSTNGKPSSSYELNRKDRSSADIPSISQESKNSALGSQRSRRITAKTDAYVFRPSLEPLSERRQQLQLAKQSAAVQAKIIEKGNFKASVMDGKNDMMERMLREHKRDQKKGYNYEALTKTIEMASKLRNDDEDSIVSSQVEGLNGVIGKAELEEDETSSASSEESDAESVADGKKSRRVKFDQALTAQEKQEERKRYAELMGGEGNESTNELMDILFDKKTGQSQKNGNDLGEEDVASWSIWQNRRALFVPEPLKWESQKSPCAQMLKEAIDSKNEALLPSLLGCPAMMALFDDLSRGHPGGNDLPSFVIWLLETSILNETGSTSYAAMTLLCEIISKKQESVLRTLISHLPQALIKMGMKSEVVKISFGEVVLSRSAKLVEERSEQFNTKTTMRGGDRMRATDRLLQVVEAYAESVKGPMSTQIAFDLHKIFILMLMFNLDKSIGSMAIRTHRLLQAIFEQISLHHTSADDDLDEMLFCIITEKDIPILPAAFLEKLPASTMSSRLFRQQLAYQIVVPFQGGQVSIYKIVSRPITFKDVAKMLESRDPTSNPLLVCEGRSYSQIYAEVQMMSFILSDFALNISTTNQTKKGVKAGAILSRTVMRYKKAMPDTTTSDDDDDIDDEEADVEEKNSLYKDKEQIDGLIRVVKALHDLGGKIQDGKGAFLNRSRVKDQIQRLRLMLQYSLSQYGITLKKTTEVSTKQVSMSRFLQKD